MRRRVHQGAFLPRLRWGPRHQANINMQAHLQDVAPRHVALNGQRCLVRLGMDLDAPLPSISTVDMEAGGALTIRSGVICDGDGAPLTVKGVNWRAPTAFL